MSEGNRLSNASMRIVKSSRDRREGALLSSLGYTILP
jgi:hypothetical protein